MSPKTRRVARTALLIAAAGVVPLMGAASAHAADNPLGGLGRLNGLTAPDPSTVTEQLPGATNAVGHSAESAGKTVDNALPAATQATQAAPRASLRRRHPPRAPPWRLRRTSSRRSAPRGGHLGTRRAGRPRRSVTSLPSGPAPLRGRADGCRTGNARRGIRGIIRRKTHATLRVRGASYVPSAP
ncbi:hypothetical protein ACU686_23020 [Yinghuangia aomiensis]